MEAEEEETDHYYLVSCDSRVRQLCSRWDSLEIHNNQLFHKWESTKPQLQWVVPTDQIKVVLEQCHDNPTGGHIGFFKTLAKIRLAYFWPGMTSDVRSWCKTCQSCRSFKGPGKKGVAPLHQVALGSPLDRMGVDILGPFPRSSKGNRYVVVTVDYFT
ncbi:unnamed protein product, partial [Nesidiocoris tenuis]